MTKMNDHILKQTSSDKILKMYAKNKEWISNIEFYVDDLHSLRNILDHYLDEILEHQNLDEIRECAMKLQDLRYTCNSILEEAQSHSIKLAKSQEKDIITSLLVKEHSALNKSLGIFKEEFKEVKKEIFTITEHVLEINKEKKLAIKLEKIKTARRG